GGGPLRRRGGCRPCRRAGRLRLGDAAAARSDRARRAGVHREAGVAPTRREETMAQTAPTDVIEALYAAMQAGDTEGVIGLLSDDVIMVVPGPPGVGGAGTWRGHDGARECFRRLGEGHVTERLHFLGRSRGGAMASSRL